MTAVFILYRTRVSGPRPAAALTVRHVHDRALVFADGVALGVLDRNRPEDTILLSVPPAGLTLEILVENMGRINYGPDLHDRKGITDGVLLGQQFLYHWIIRPLPLDDLSGLTFAPGSAVDGPRFFRGTFTVPEPLDTFLALPGWRKGACWINGRNLGRYWDIGPQKTLYVPGPWLRAGENELIVFELHECREPRVEFRDRPDLGE